MTLLLIGLAWLVVGSLAVWWAARTYGLPPEVAKLDLAFSAVIWPVFLAVIISRNGWNF